MNELSKNVVFSQLSITETWFDLAKNILPLLVEPSASGFQTATELVSALAAARKLTPRALLKQVDAAKFLLDAYPGLITKHGVEGGHSQVEYLAKIYKLEKPIADEIAVDVIRGNMTMASMNARYLMIRDQQSPQGQSPAVQARMRGIRFEETCYRLLQENSGEFGAQTPSDIVRDYKVNRLTLDAAVVRDGKLITALEFIAAGVASAPRDALPIVAKLALCRYRTSSVWLFLPAWAESLAQAIQEELRAWGVDGVRIALVAESEGSASLKFIKEL